MTIVFFDVDTQKDFMNRDGALYVPGAEEIKPILEKLSQFADYNNIRILGSVDRHFEKDPELIRNGGPFPDHCMDRTEGQKKIPETEVRAYYVESEKQTQAWIRHKIDIYSFCGASFIFEKQGYSVFPEDGGNQNIDEFLKRLGVDCVFVYGVATEYCVRSAVLGFLKRGKETIVIVDAISAVDKNKGLEALDEMKKAGANLITFDSLERSLLHKTMSAGYEELAKDHLDFSEQAIKIYDEDRGSRTNEEGF